MRPTLSSLASKASPLKQYFPQSQPSQTPPKVNSLTSFGQNPSLNPSTGNKNPILKFNSISTNYNHQSNVNPLDHHYFRRVLANKDWFLLLNHEIKAKRLVLNPQCVVSILQNQENPIYCLRFYIWVSNISPLFVDNRSIRGVLSNGLYRKGPVLLSAELILDLRKAGLGVSENLLCILIGSWGRLGLAKYCAEVFEQVSYLGISPSTRLYNAVIDGLVKSNSLDLAYLKFQQMQVDNCVPDRFTYNILIHGVCKAGVMDEALRLVTQMEGLGLKPNVYTYSILVDGFCVANRVDEAFRILDIMKEKNVKPNEATFRSLANGVFRCFPPHEALQVLTRWIEREPVFPKIASDIVLHCLADNNLPKEVAFFLTKFKDRGYFPDNTTFTILISCMIKGLEIDVTCQIFDSFTKQGMRVGFDTYLALTEALYQSGREAKGNYYMDQIFRYDFVTSVHSFNIVIDCFCKANMIERALETFEMMSQRGVSANLVTFNTLISGLCKSREMGKARDLLLMLLELGFIPDVFTFSSIIDGLCRVHHIQDAFDCFTEMVEWGINPNSITYNIIIRSLCITGSISKAIALLRKMQVDGIKPDIFSFNALIQSYCRNNQIEKAQRLLISMLTLDLRPDNFTYSAFIKALCGRGRFDEAKVLFWSMEDNGCPPDAFTCNSYIETLIGSDRLEEAQEVFSGYDYLGLQVKPII
ncbi:hypothetical protein LIER_18300 [Lithospermum erythrorhizon]|uniref:Pentatricopeptide repeat-containing protein n=1 Tax=Lithospermum erythrorhizon TaxID=34254 RepID=A0AAV3QGN0_LITER